MDEDDLIYDLTTVPDRDPIAMSEVDGATFRKQAIYTGTFFKTVKGQKIGWKVDRNVLRHWATTGNLMLSQGISIPMPEHHTDDATAKRGDVLKFEVGTDSKGRDALFYHWAPIEGLDEKTLAALKASDCSIYVPLEYTHAVTGDVYEHPIRHIAFTNSPVVPDLDKSTALAASYQIPEESVMDLKQLAELLGLTVPEGADDDAIKKLIADARKAREDEVEALKKENEELKKKKDPEPTPKPKDKAEPTPLAAGFQKIAFDNRTGAIDGLVTGGHITPAAATKLKEQFVTTDHIAMAMSDDGTFSDGFDGLVESLKENQAIQLGERTGPQSKLKDEDNPVKRDAMRRAKEFEERQKQQGGGV